MNFSLVFYLIFFFKKNVLFTFQTVKDCIEHYYITKKKVNYKLLMRKQQKKRKNAKSSNNNNNNNNNGGNNNNNNNNNNNSSNNNINNSNNANSNNSNMPTAASSSYTSTGTLTNRIIQASTSENLFRQNAFNSNANMTRHVSSEDTSSTNNNNNNNNNNDNNNNSDVNDVNSGKNNENSDNNSGNGNSNNNNNNNNDNNDQNGFNGGSGNGNKAKAMRKCLLCKRTRNKTTRRLPQNKCNLLNDNIKSIINVEFDINLNEIDLNSENEKFCHSCYNKFVKKLDELTKQQQQQQQQNQHDVIVDEQGSDNNSIKSANNNNNNNKNKDSDEDEPKLKIDENDDIKSVSGSRDFAKHDESKVTVSNNNEIVSRSSSPFSSSSSTDSSKDSSKQKTIQKHDKNNNNLILQQEQKDGENKLNSPDVIEQSTSKELTSTNNNNAESNDLVSIIIDNAIKKELVVPKINLVDAGSLAPPSQQNTTFVGGSITKGTPLVNPVSQYSPPASSAKYSNVQVAAMLDQAFNDATMSDHVRNSILQQSGAANYNVLGALLQANADKSNKLANLNEETAYSLIEQVIQNDYKKDSNK